MLFKLLALQLIVNLLVFSDAVLPNRETSNKDDRIKGSVKHGTRDLPKSPIILVPGDGGSQLEARVNKPSVVHYICEQRTDEFFTLWLNLADLVPFVVDCWVDNMRLVYEPTNRTTRNPPGVEVRVPGFGNTTTVEYVDPSQVSVAGYFNVLVQEMVDFGYVRGVSIRGAPYDFRKSPRELGDFYKRFKELVEETYQLNGRRKVIVVCHSLGCPTMLYFFNRQKQHWKNRYIKSFITLAGVWGGAVKALKAYTSGDNFGVPMITGLTIRKEERTFPSLAYLLPSDRFWPRDEVIITTGKRNYSVADYKQFFADIGFDIGYEMWKDTKDLTHDMKPPGITTHCIHGVGLETMKTLSYNHELFPNHEPHVEWGDGDGTVNLRSLHGCRQWIGKQSKPVYYLNFTEMDHMQVMTDSRVIEYLKTIAIHKIEEEPASWWDSFWDMVSGVYESISGSRSDITSKGFTNS